VIWAGLTGPQPAHLFDLREHIVRSLAQLGHYTDDSNFHPHVTLGRLKSNRRAAPDLSVTVERHRSWHGGSFTVLEVVTFASTLGPGGPRYDALSHAPLLGQKNRG
jgi:2'-5' RNA ligase